MPDFMGLMKQAAQLQSKMEALQAELDQIEVEGAAGGDLVKVRLTAKSDLKGVSIDASLWKPEPRDRRGPHHRRPCRRAAQGRALLQDKMKQLTGGLPLPPGMKLFRRARPPPPSPDPKSSA
jgi:DNA-binding protein YbaB